MDAIDKFLDEPVSAKSTDAIDAFLDAPSTDTELAQAGISAKHAAQIPLNKRSGVPAKETAFQRTVSNPLGSLIYGAVQGLGQIPAGVAEMAPTLILPTFPGGNVVEESLGNYIKGLVSPISDLGGKAFNAVGLPTTSESPQIKNPNAAALGEIIAPFLVGTPQGRAIPSKIGNIPASIENTIAQRGILRQPLAAAATEALGITPEAGSAEIIPVLKSSLLEANAGKLPTNLAPKEALKQAADFTINQYKDGLKSAEDLGMQHSVESLRDAMRAKLDKFHTGLDASQKNDIIKAVEAENPTYFKQSYISPPEGQTFAVEVNRNINKINPLRSIKSDAQINAETALSEELSRQGSEMYQAATGKLGTPNQDWGVLKQAQEGLAGELESAQKAAAGKKVGGDYMPHTLTGILAKGVKKIGGRALIPTKEEGVVGSFGRVLNESEARPIAEAIDPTFQQAIIQKYTPSSIAPSNLPAAAPFPTPILPNPDFIAAVRKLGYDPNSLNGQMLLQQLQNGQVISARP